MAAEAVLLRVLCGHQLTYSYLGLLGPEQQKTTAMYCKLQETQQMPAFQEAKMQLLLMVDVLRDIDVDHKGGHTAAADMAYLYAMTQVWFTAERDYKVRTLHCYFPSTNGTNTEARSSREQADNDVEQPVHKVGKARLCETGPVGQVWTLLQWHWGSSVDQEGAGQHDSLL